MRGPALVAAIAVSASLIGAGWFAASSLAGKELTAAAAVPGSIAFTDATGEDPQAPDIAGVKVSNSAGDDVTVKVEVTNHPALDADLRVSAFLDTDRSDATGRPGDGADFALAVDGTSPAGATLMQWSDGTWETVPSTIHATYSTGEPPGPEITVPRAELANTAGFDVVATAEDADATDRAPDVGDYAYALASPADDVTTETTTVTTPPETTTVTSTVTTPPETTTVTTPPSTVTTTVTAPPVTTTVATTSTVTNTVIPPPSTVTLPGSTTTVPSPPSTSTTTVSTPGPTTTVVRTSTVQQTTSIVSTTVQTTTAPGSTTTTVARPLDQCANIGGLQTKVPRGLVKRNGKCVSTLSLSASGLVKRPARPVAGQQFAVGATILNSKTKKKLPSATVSCPAVVAGKSLGAQRQLFDKRHSAAYCYWMIPASARGTVLQVAVVATYQGAHVRRWFRAQVQ